MLATLKKTLPLFCSAVFGINACTNNAVIFSQIPLTPIPHPPQETQESPQIFSGKAGNIEVRFLTYRNAEDADIDSFPEPPVTVINSRENTQCTIDGGNWSRKDIYLSGDERYLLLGEFDGSYDALVSYDTGTCREIKRLDVSEMRWEIQGSEARLGKNCGKGTYVDDCTSTQPLDLRIFVNQ
jgi:hypothetical protein